MEPIEIPDYIDDPPHVLLWSLDELAPPMIGVVLGIWVGQLTLMVVLGLIVGKLYSRYRDSKPDGYLNHKLYKYGLLPVKGRTFPNPYSRKFIAK